MADIQIHEIRKKQGVQRRKKFSVKIDLTPMVDLGFLLITFFVFTTSLSTPHVMKLTMPFDDLAHPSVTPAGKTLSLLLDKGNQIFYYNGDSLKYFHKTDYSPEGLRSVLLSKKSAVEKSYGDSHETVVLIKPTEYASYENIVDALDEMQINEITRYVLMDADKEEKSFIERAAKP